MELNGEGCMSELQNELIELVNSKIHSYSGIYVAKSQFQTLIDYIDKESAKKGLSPMEYVQTISPDTQEFDELINLITVNETYFFREEKQFDFLREEVFPKFMGKNLTIWTCCCSTGEEPISLLALALSMNVNLTIYASDIDDNALATLRRGHYSLYSLRSDGAKYHKLLEPYSTKTDTEIIFNRDFLRRIQSFKFNLTQDELSKIPFYENADIIFMRNVFIYFDKPTRILVTEKISERLKNDGILFFSMNEIGSLDNSVISEKLYKTNYDVVYYFVKGVNKKNKSVSEIINQKREKEKQLRMEELMKEKFRLEIEKSKKNSLEREKEAKEKKRTELQERKNQPDNSTNDSTIKSTYEDVCYEINRGDFIKARTIARAISGTDTKKYSFFMLGYIEYHADNRAAAETFFASAESISPDFWPAFFYHGMVLRDLGKTAQANECFSKCKKLISDFGNKGAGSSVPYDFTLDSFSPSYIYSLCETFSMGGGF